MRLHENEEDFRDLCSITAGYIGIPEDAVRRDYYIGEYAIKLINGNGKKMDEETISLATLRAYLWYAANMDIFLQSIALSASHVPFIKEAKKEKQIIQDKDMKALLAVPPDTQKGNRDQNKRGLSP
ncbi:MAG: hypothetical protein ACLU80_00025 [Dorea sp.]